MSGKAMLSSPDSYEIAAVAHGTSPEKLRSLFGLGPVMQCFSTCPSRAHRVAKGMVCFDES